MSKELRELLNKLDTKNKEMTELINKDTVTTEELDSISKEIDLLQAKVEAQKKSDELENKFNNNEGTELNKNTENEEKIDAKSAFIKAIKATAKRETIDKKTTEALNALTMTEGVPGDGGLTVPQDIKTSIMELRRSYPDNLENYVNIERVNTLSGSRVIEVESELVGFDNIDEAADFPQMHAPTFRKFEYKVKKKGGTLEVTRELLEDTAENIKGYLTRWIAKKDKVTRNALILKLLNDNLTTVKPVSKIDDLKDIFNVSLDPAFELTSIILMNQDAFNYLDKLKDERGDYLLQPNPVQATQRLLFGKYPIVKVSNKTLPTVANKAALYCGDLKEMVTIFDRESLSIEFNDIGYKYWNSDKIGMKVRERLDIQPVDVKAVIKAEIDISKAPVKTK